MTPPTDLLNQMQPFLRNHLVGAHHYDHRALAGMDGEALHHIHMSQPTGHCHHDSEHRPAPEPLLMLTELRDSLPEGHHEHAGLIRAIEALRHAGYDDDDTRTADLVTVLAALAPTYGITAAPGEDDIGVALRLVALLPRGLG